jgi:hypothetical protein
MKINIDRLNDANNGGVFHLNLNEILIFSATVCASDSVAALVKIYNIRP